MDIFSRITALNMPKGTFVVVGGGVLVALGLLKWDEDIDLCVTPDIFAQFKAQGWRQEEWGGKPVLKHDIYDVGIGFGEWDHDELLLDAMYVNNIPFLSLEKLLQWKQLMGRPKDLRHIALIKKYMQEHASTSL